MKNDFGHAVPEPPTVPATAAFLELLSDPLKSPFEVMEDFHPAFAGSLTLVHPSTHSAITVVVVESSDDGEEHR